MSGALVLTGWLTGVVASAAEPRVRVDPERSAANAAMDRYADGEEEAFGELYDLLAPRLFGFASKLTRNPTAAEDVVQQTLLQMHCARDRYRRGAEVVPWAFAIARRLVIDAHRRSAYQEVLGKEDDAEPPRSTDDPLEALESKRAAEVIARTLEAMPEGQREAFILVREEGLTMAEAASVLGSTEGAIKVRVHRASEALKAALAERNRSRGAE